MILMILWILYTIFLPGHIITALILRKGVSQFNILERAILNLTIGLYYVAIVAYLLDFFVGFSLVNMACTTLVFIIIGVYFARDYLFGTFFKRLEFVWKMECRRNALFLIGMLSVLTYVAILVLWALATNLFIYPSDPVSWLFQGRYLATQGHLALLLRETSQGYAMTRPLGFHYFLATLFSLDISNSYDIMRFAGPLFGIISLLAIYAVTLRVTISKFSAILAMLFAGTNYLWVWFTKLTVPVVVIEFMILTFFLTLYILLQTSGAHKLEFSYILLPVIASAIWMYHPPTFLMLITPLLIWYFIRGRKLVSVTRIIKMSILFFAFTLPFWILLNENSFKQRLMYEVATINIAQASATYLTLEYLLKPFSAYWSYAPLIPIAFSLIGYVKQASDKRKHLPEMHIYEILLLTLILQCLYWANPVPSLRAFFENQLPINRIPLYLSVTGSVMVGYGFNELVMNLRRRWKQLFKTSTNVRAKKDIAYTFLIVLLILAPVMWQVYWGYSKFEYGIFRSEISEGTPEMVQWIDNNLPLDARILFDENNTPGLEKDIEKRFAGELWWIRDNKVKEFYKDYRLHRELAGSIYARSSVWLSYCALYPRKVIGFETLFWIAETGRINHFLGYLKENGVTHVAMTKPNAWPRLLAFLKLFSDLEYEAKGTLLFKIEKLMSIEFEDEDKTLISNCESPDGWAFGTFGIDTTDFKEGNGSLKQVYQTLNPIYWAETKFTFQKPLDLTNYTILTFWLKSSRASEDFKITRFLIVTVNGSAWWSISFSSDNWERIWIVLNTPNGIIDNPNYEEVTRIIFVTRLPRDEEGVTTWIDGVEAYKIK